MEKPLISIIVPVYNGEKYLDECIKSILNQTYTNFELILINDGSADSSASICEKWKNQDNRILFIDKKNEGAAIARNIGLDLAKGDLIGFVDNDDIVEQNMYETMYNDMKTNDADIVMCSSRAFDENTTYEKNYFNYSAFKIQSKELIQRMLEYEKIFCSSVWSKLYKKSAIGDVRFKEDIFLGDDYYFNGNIYLRINKFYYNAKVLYNYRIQRGSMTRSDIGEHFFDKYKVALYLEKDMKKFDFINSTYIERFKLSVLHEILFELCKKTKDRKLIKEWKSRYYEQYKRLSRIYKISICTHIKCIVIGHCPVLYSKINQKKR